MTKINFQKKINNINETEKDFLETYAERIISREFIKTSSSTNKSTGKTKYTDIYNLNLSPYKMKKYGSEKITILDLFEHHYIYNISFKNLVDELKSIFNIKNSPSWKKNLLKEIIIMDTFFLKKTVKILDNHKLDNKTLKIIKLIFQYENSRGIIVEFVRRLDFRVCIYCNRNFINNFVQKKGKYKSGADKFNDRELFTLDHYYQHADYPLLGLSFFNLIPSCHVCNSMIKSSRNEISQFKNPYDKKYNFHDLATFKLMKAKKVELISHNIKCQKYIDDFYINEVYKTHSVDVAEQLNKRDIFTDKTIKQYAEMSKTTEQEVKDAVFGLNINIDNFDQIPLGKLMYDIQEQLKIK